MAQTKRKRPSKHRGNAAGMIEARGRTGRRPTDGEKRPTTAGAGKGKPKAAVDAKGRAIKPDRYASPPTWRGAVNRAVIAAALVAGFSVLFLHKFTISQAFLYFPLILLVYIPLGYYTDLFIYNRRQRQKVK